MILTRWKATIASNRIAHGKRNFSIRLQICNRDHEKTVAQSGEDGPISLDIWITIVATAFIAINQRTNYHNGLERTISRQAIGSFSFTSYNARHHENQVKAVRTTE